jgi:hypothetical protein
MPRAGGLRVELLRVAPEFRHQFEEAGFTSSAAVSQLVPQPAGKFRPVVVKALTLSFADGSTEQVYFKRYNYRRPAWQFLGRASKARREFENYAVFRQLHIRCADAMAMGESRDWLGRLKSAWIITRAVPESVTLIEFVQKHCPNRSSPQFRELRGSLLDQLAQMTRQIHAADFFHNDLVWRNVLVTWSPPAPPVIWWIDCPRGRFSRLARRRPRIKDLALLDKLASRYCSQPERLRFVKVYLGRNRVDGDVRQWAQDVLTYGSQRW